MDIMAGCREDCIEGWVNQGGLDAISRYLGTPSIGADWVIRLKVISSWYPSARLRAAFIKTYQSCTFGCVAYDSYQTTYHDRYIRFRIFIPMSLCSRIALSSNNNNNTKTTIIIMVMPVIMINRKNNIIGGTSYRVRPIITYSHCSFMFYSSLYVAFIGFQWQWIRAPKSYASAADDINICNGCSGPHKKAEGAIWATKKF